jgi:hypothetical protein
LKLLPLKLLLELLNFFLAVQIKKK